MGEARMLKIVGGAVVAFDGPGWRRAVREAGLLKVLTRSELAVLWLALDMADRVGEVDLPRGYLAGELGMTVKAVRTAVEKLEGERGLLEAVGVSPASAQVKRYRLAWPGAVPASNHEAESVDLVGVGGLGSDPAEAGSAGGPAGECLGFMGGSGVTGGSGVRGVVGYRGGGSGVSPRGVVDYPQSKGIAAAAEDLMQQQQGKEAGGRSAPAEAGRPGSGVGGLFERPGGFDRRAAAVLVSVGIAPKVAAGLVSQYAVSRVAARNVRANLAARKRAGYAVTNPAGWVRSCLKRGETAVEAVLEAELADRRAKRRRRAEAARRDQAARRSAEAREREGERLAAAERELAGMGAREVAELEAVVTAGLVYRPSAAMVRGWVLEELVRGGAKPPAAPGSGGGA